MRTIRWCPDHFDGQGIPLQLCMPLEHTNRWIAKDMVVIDPSDPEDVAEFLQSLGFKHQDVGVDCHMKPNPGEVSICSIHREHGRVWVGPWEEA